MSSSTSLPARAALFALVSLASAARPAAAQGSFYALRFYGIGSDQEDRVRIRIDDDAPGPDASAPCDVGLGSFTLELWLRGELADNDSANAGGDVETSDLAWILGNIVFDRDIWGGSERDFGLSIAGGYVRFGTGRGDQGADPSDHTIEGDVNVLDGAWHHVACVRDVADGRKRIYVDGVLDFASSAGVSFANLSYPNGGVPGQQTPWGPFIVLAAEKHDAGPAFPSFAGFLDEVRVWSVARSQAEIQQSAALVLPPGVPGLVGSWRFEEGAGTSVADSSGAASPAGELIAGLPGNGEWVSQARDPANTAPIGGGGLPPGFVRSVVASGLDEPTVVELADDGRAFIGQRGGTIRVVADGALLPAPLIEIPADVQNGERGLVGLALDPSFASNGWIYAYYTTLEPRNRVSRFTVVGNTAALASELVLWANAELAADYHHGGALGFGPAGMLYIATGDQFQSSSAQDLGRHHGKLLRIAPDGSVPADNPFANTPGALPEIWALGLRNPFRFAFDALTGELYVGDVGGNQSDSWEELNRGEAGANYGWPEQEGPECYVSDCSAHTFPIWSYRHDDPTYAPGPAQASIIAGPRYRANAFPASYRGDVFVGDYANRWIRRLVLDDGGAVVADPPFLAAPEAGTVVDLDVGRDGALYFVTIGVPWSGSPDVGTLQRVAYSAGGNQPPVVSAAADPVQGPVPLAVQFSSAGSYDPDQGPAALVFDWDFGDGQGSDQPDPLHTFSSPGLYLATLTLEDGEDESVSGPLAIVAGNPPLATIVEPIDGTTYRAGDTILFSGTAVDPDDGPLPAASFTWRVVLVHAGHAHPFLGPIEGVASGSFVVPASGHEPENTHYEIELAVVDSDGLPGSAVRAIKPVPSRLRIDTVPSGIPIFLDGAPVATPRTYQSLVGYQHELAAQDAFELDGVTWTFCAWVHGGPQSQTFVAPEVGASLTAVYMPAGGEIVEVAVPAAQRNADWWPPVGQGYGNFYDPLGICAGRDDSGPYQMGLEFPLGVPQGARVLSARLRFVPTTDQSGSPTFELFAYDVPSAPPFVEGSPTSLTAHAPLTSAMLVWSPPAFAPGVPIDSPELAALVQEVVARPDWQPGSFLGLVLDGSPSTSGEWRCVSNYASGAPPMLTVSFDLAPGGCPIPPMRSR